MSVSLGQMWLRLAVCGALLVPSALANFSFGMIATMDSTIAIQTFILTITLLIALEFIIGFLDFALKDKVIYSHMLQRIYRELTTMGLMSFGIVMIIASGQANNSPYLAGVDFAHYLLFFTVIFFVGHSFYLMYNSAHTGSEYLAMERMDDTELLEECSNHGWLQSIMFHARYVPWVSRDRDCVEYKILERIFKDAYWLPEDFDFAAYLTQQFEHLALKTMDINLFNWLVLIMLVILNYIRTAYNLGFNCNGKNDAAYAQQFVDTVGDVRRLAASAATFEPTCTRLQLYLMSICSALLFIYACGVLLMARYYELKLLERANIYSSKDYLAFLSLIADDTNKREEYEKECRLKRRVPESCRMSIGELELVIQDVFDEMETGEDGEEAIYAKVGEVFTRVVEAFEELRDSCVEHVAKQMGNNAVAVTDNALKLQALLTSNRLEEKEEKKKKTDSEASIAVVKMLRKRRLVVAANPRMSVEGNKPGGNSWATYRAVMQATSGSSRSRGRTRSGSGGSDELLQQQSVADASARRSSIRLGVSEAGGGGAGGAGGGVLLNEQAREFVHQSSEKRKVERMLLAPALIDAFPRAKATQPWWSKLVGGITAEAAAGGNGTNAGRRQGTILPSSATSPNKVAPAPADIEAGSAEGEGEGRGAEVAKETDGEHRPAALSSSAATTSATTTSSSSSSGGGANNRLPTSPSNDDSPSDSADGSESESKAETGRGAGNAKKEESPSEKAQAYSNSHTDFKDIFLGGRPQYFYWSVDVCIMFCCFYLAMWATNFISLTEAYPDARVMWHVILIGPVFLVLQLLAMINKTVSLLNAVCALDLKLTLCTIKDTLEMHETMREMRDFTLSKIREVFGDLDDQDSRLEVVDTLFNSIDKDGSGQIDKNEFRALLRNLSLRYSNERYRKLFRAIDRDGGGTIDKSEYFKLLFPDEEYTEARKPAAEVVRLQRERQIAAALKKEQEQEHDMDMEMEQDREQELQQGGSGDGGDDGTEGGQQRKVSFQSTVHVRSITPSDPLSRRAGDDVGSEGDKR